MSNKLKFAKQYTLLDNGSYERMINRETPSPQFNLLEGEAVRGVKRAHAEMEKALEDPSKVCTTNSPITLVFFANT